MKILVAILIIFSSSLSWAECYVVGDLKGKAVRENDKYQFSSDSFSGQKFMVEINGEKSSVTPNDITCTEGGLNTVLCMSNTSVVTSIELWAVYPKDRKVVYSKIRTGLGAFDGGMLFVGNVLGQCGS